MDLLTYIESINSMGYRMPISGAQLQNAGYFLDVIHIAGERFGQPMLPSVTPRASPSQAVS